MNIADFIFVLDNFMHMKVGWKSLQRGKKISLLCFEYMYIGSLNTMNVLLRFYFVTDSLIITD